MKVKCDQAELSTITMLMIIMITTSMVAVLRGAEAGNTNDVYDPCSDSKVQKFDGFTFGIAFSAKENFFSNETQLSPCDKRLSLLEKRAPLAVFRPKVDEISLLSIDSDAFDPVLSFMSQPKLISASNFVDITISYVHIASWYTIVIVLCIKMQKCLNNSPSKIAVIIYVLRLDGHC